MGRFLDFAQMAIGLHPISARNGTSWELLTQKHMSRKRI
jgi:hypothetical protein